MQATIHDIERLFGTSDLSALEQIAKQWASADANPRGAGRKKKFTLDEVVTMKVMQQDGTTEAQLAKQYKTSWTAVERNIRTVIGVAWKQERPFLEYLAQRKLPGKPGAAQLLAIIAYWLLTDAGDATPSLMEREGPEFSQAGKSPILPSSI